MTANASRNPSAWTVVLPFYNEEGFLEETLASLAAQTLPARLILVDNASTDRSPEIAGAFARDHPHLAVTIVLEETPGKASALETGIALVETDFVATADADTFYPPDYLEQANALFEKAGPGGVATLAFGTPREGAPGHGPARRKGAMVSRLMPRQTHSGGYGQSFRTADLKAVGGFSRDLWPYCLMDHEIMHRLTKRGRLLYSADHWCAPSPRRSDRARVRWTLGERLLYHVTPFERRDWFFYKFLKKRFDARGVSELNLRKKEWATNHAKAGER
ncbi:MAG: glycosyltransferase family A protein [Pseudomonadota bacterium]